MRRHFYYIILLLLPVVFQACSGDKKRLPDLSETYGYREMKPFGSYIAYHLLENSYRKRSVQIKKGPFVETAAWIMDTASVYVNISSKYFVDEKDADALLDYVYKGNTALIAAAEIDTVLLKKLYCREDFFDERNSMLRVPKRNSQVSLVEGMRSYNDTSFGYYYYPFSNNFSELNDRYCRIAGYNQAGKPNFFVFFWGKGRFFIHCDPRAFSNYFLLQDNNMEYVYQQLRVLPADPEHIFWDDYYNKLDYHDDGSDGSLLGAIFRHPELKIAFWMIILLLLLYILLNGKRRQRIIPVIKPVQNSSVAFAEAIAGVYLTEKDNRTIAEKMISYFNESVRTRYFLNTNVINSDFLDSLSRKSTVPLEKTTALYGLMQQLTKLTQVSDMQLLQLNEQIQQFNKYKN